MRTRSLLLFTAVVVCLFTTGVKALQVHVVSIPSTCGGPDGALTVEIMSGTPPYTYSWYNDQGSLIQENTTSATFDQFVGLSPGFYSLTVVDGVMDVANEGSLEVSDQAGGTLLYIQSIANCPGDPPIALVNMIENGIVDIWGPDVIDSSQQLDECGGYTYRALMFPEYGSYPLQYQTQNGCILDAWAYLTAPETLPTMQVVGVVGSCGNGASGRITVAYGGVSPFPQVVTRLKNDAGVVVVGGCPASGIELAGLIGTPYTFTGLAAGTYWVHVSGQTFNFNFTNWYDYQCRDSIQVVVPALPGDCGVVNGRVFVDNNSNCVANPGENNVPATVVRLEPGPFYANTNSSGQYSVQVPYGTYDVFADHPVLEQSCSVVQVVQQAALSNVNVPMAPGAPLDMQVTLNDGPARPGFEYQIAVQVRNLTASAAGIVTLQLQYDPLLSLTSSSITPTTTAGNTLTWSGGAFAFTNAFQSRNIILRFQIPPDVGLLGTELLTTATVTTTNADADLSNNTSLLERTITGAYDPNDKLAATSSGNTDVWQLGADEWIDYTIRFQNTGTDTAFNVMITDTLPGNLDPGSIVIGASSHFFNWELRDQGTLKFYFANIQLPDSNVNEAFSHGFVGFRIKPSLPLNAGDQIENIANIYFDFNPPVITEPSVLVVPAPTVTVQVKSFLAGPYDPSTGLMHDQLRTGGWLPLNEPYSGLGYSHVGGGSESTTMAVLGVTGSHAIVDWVVVELRHPSTPSQILHSRSALLRRDGQVVDVDGVSPVGFNAPVGNYHVAIKHRNHLACMTATPIALGTASSLIDLSSSATSVWGSQARINLSGTMLLWPGDVNFDGVVKYSGASNDRDQILIAIGGSSPTNTVVSYGGSDVNMDGIFKYTGTSNDRDIILQTIGGVVPTNVRVEQVP